MTGYPLWTDEELTRARAIAAEHGYALAAETFGLTPKAIKCRLARAAKASSRPYTPILLTDRDMPTIEDFARVAKSGLSLEELCDRFTLPPRKVRDLVSRAQKAGYRIELTGGMVGYTPPVPVRGERKVIAQPGEEHAYAVVSDIHIGSKYCLEDQFRDFVQRAYDEGVRTIFCPGDILDGVYRHSRWEESHHGFDAQARRAAEVFPQLEGLKYVGIVGNHDETFEKESGLDVCRAIEDVFRRSGRDDLTLLGARGAYVRFAPKGGRGVLIELWHPLGGGAYAVSYKLQRHVEEYGVGQKPDFMFAGHWHQQCYVVRRGVHCFSAGTFHGGGSAFGKALGGAQAIGGWIVRFKQTKDGTVRDVQPTWCAYYETETVREAGLT
jgi:predicted phosphodiesterase